MTRDRRKGPNVSPMSVVEALEHLRKAQEYRRAAEYALGNEDFDAAAGNAVLAGINAADCVSGLEQGNRWSGPHGQAPAHIKKGGLAGRAVAGQLSKLLRRKTQAHYEVTRLTMGDAKALVLACQRAVHTAGSAAEAVHRSSR